MTWATIDDTQDITGRGVTASQMAAANATVTIYANRTPAASAAIGARDLYWLQQAACWQAAWLSQQVAVDGRSLTTSQSQDGLSAATDAEYAHVLAPLAARSLRNLSWKATRSIAVGQAGSVPPWTRNFLLESSDEFHGWEPLEGVGG